MKLSFTLPRSLITVFFSAAASCVLAEDLVLQSGKRFAGVEYVTEDDSRVKIRHADGLAWINKRDVPIEFLKKVGASIPPGVEQHNAADLALKKRIEAFKASRTEFKTRDGVVRKAAHISAVEVTGLKLEFDGAITRIPFELLPSDVVAFFGFDPTAVAAARDMLARQKQAAAEEEERMQFAESVIQSGLVELQMVNKDSGGFRCMGRSFTKENERIVQGESLDVMLVFGLPNSFLETKKWSGDLWFGPARNYTTWMGEELTARLAFTSRLDAKNYIVKNGYQLEARPTTPSSPDIKGTLISGSGFAISENHVVTAFHVIDGKDMISVEVEGKPLPARVAAKDQNNDLAILQVEGAKLNPLQLGSAEKQSLGDEVFTVGFPDPSVQGRNIKLTRGHINSTSGIQDNSSLFQISAGVHGGNSGGPLLNKSGQVIGVIISKLGAKYFLRTMELPQQVNYAVKVDFLKLLSRNLPEMANLTSSPQSATTTSPEMAAERATFLIEAK